MPRRCCLTPLPWWRHDRTSAPLRAPRHPRRPAGRRGRGPADAPAERQLTLLAGGDARHPSGGCSQRTRVVGKRGVADARAVLADTARARATDDDADAGPAGRVTAAVPAAPRPELAARLVHPEEASSTLAGHARAPEEADERVERAEPVHVRRCPPTLDEWRALAAKELNGRRSRQRSTCAHARGDPGQAALHRGRPRRPRGGRLAARRRAVRPRRAGHDVRQPAVDDPPVRRLLHGRGVQRLLPRATWRPGRQGLSVAFDLATHRGYDSDHPRVVGDVGKAGVAIDSVEDMKILFDGIPLDRMSRVDDHERRRAARARRLHRRRRRSRACRRPSCPGPSRTTSSRSSWSATPTSTRPGPACGSSPTSSSYTAEHMPKFNSISISGYHMQEAGATAVQELAFTLADGLEYVPRRDRPAASTSTPSPAASRSSSPSA